MEASNLSVLYIDDDELIAKVVKRFLDRRFSEVYIAYNANEAMNIYDTVAIDFVITDIHMPDMDGVALLTFLQKKNPDIIAVAISSDASEETLLKVMRAGFYDFVKKPLDPKQFQNQLIRIEKTVMLSKKYVKQENDLKQYKALVDRTVLTCRTDLNGVITSVNDFYCKTYGYSADELIGDTHKKLRHPSTPPSMYKKLWEELSNNKEVSAKVINCTKNGQIKVIDHLMAPWYDENGIKVGYYDIGNDITAIYKQQQSAKHKSKWLQNIINNLNDIIAVTDGKQMLLVNNALLEFLGYESLDDFTSQHTCICEFFEDEPGYITKNDTWLQKTIISTAEGKKLKVKMKNKNDNKYHIFNLSANAIEGSNTYILVFHDETKYELERENLMEEVNTATWQLMDSQSEFQAQLERFDHAINSSRDGFWDLDMRSHEFYLSPGWKKRLGFAEDEVLSYRDYIQLIDNENLPEQTRYMLDLLEKTPEEEKDKLSFSLQYTLKTKSGEEVIIDDIGNVLYNEDMNPYRIVGFHRDISKQENERKVLQSQNRLASLGEMISNIAHQWRQPVAAINTVVNDLEFEIDLDELEAVPSERIQQVGSDIKIFTEHLSKTIDDFRDFVKTDKVKETFSLLQSIESANSIVSHSLTQAGIEYEIRYEIDDSLTIVGFPRELAQVIINILNNARDALLEKKIVNPKVWIDVNIQKTDLVILIGDNAGGIPKNVIDKVFDPYFTTKHESIGTGIGLSMSKNIIDTHFNGKLTVKNSPEGAVFSILLPME